MPDYTKLHDLMSHRVALEYDTGAQIVGYLASVVPAKGSVQFATLQKVELIDASGKVVHRVDELTISPNVLVGFRMDEGPRGRDL